MIPRPSVIRAPVATVFHPADVGDSSRPLTERQHAIVRFLRESIERDRIPPTLREIAQAFDIRSTNGVNDHLRALAKKGYLHRGGVKSRALRLLRDEHGKPFVMGPRSQDFETDVRLLLRRLVTLSLPADLDPLIARCRNHLGEES